MVSETLRLLRQQRFNSFSVLIILGEILNPSEKFTGPFGSVSSVLLACTLVNSS